MKFFKIITPVLLVLLVFLIALFARPKIEEPIPPQGLFSEKPTVTLKGKVYTVDIADSPEERNLGLSFREPLSSTSGMFFIFEKADIYPFWMKDMKFPIDIIWIDETFKVVHIEKSVSPNSYPKSFSPGVAALYVLEVLAGESNKVDLKIGDPVLFSQN